MSACFIGAVCPLDISFEEAAVKVITMTDYEVAELLIGIQYIFDMYIDGAYEELPDGYDDMPIKTQALYFSPLFEELAGMTCKDYLLSLLKDVIDSDNDCWGTWTLNGRDYAFTGGISHGDDPSDVYQTMNLLAEIGITYDRWDTSIPLQSLLPNLHVGL